MFEFFDTIIGFISTVVDFFVGALMCAAHFVIQIAKGIVFVSSTIVLLPPFCQGFLYTLMAVCILSALLSFFVDLK